MIVVEHILHHKADVARADIWPADDVGRTVIGSDLGVEQVITFIELSEKIDDEFVQLARNVYFTNDKRASIKRNIDLLLGSRIMEEKSYQTYA